MKKILLFASIGLLFLLQACYDDYKEDYIYSTTYFARQYPLRTLVAEPGEEMAFEIGVVLGGKYENAVDEVVDFIVEDTLLNSYPDLVELPESYYSLEGGSITIPSGEFQGSMKVTLDKDKFMSDELAKGKNYALPLKMVAASTDSILEHKDYTIIVIRYYNEYHGWYYLKGTDSKLDEAGNVVESVVYAEEDLVSNEDMLLETTAKDSVLVPFIGQFYNDQKKYTMLMGVNNDACTLIGENTDNLTEVNGTGSYSPSERQFTLDYSYIDADGAKHQVNDMLIFRNTELILEDWQ